MKLLTLLLCLTLLAIKCLAHDGDGTQDVPIIQDNPKSATFQAVLQTGKQIQGQITGVSHDNGTGVDLNINFFDFPRSEDGPFKYHIHVDPVSSDGNCSSTGGHFSPYGREDTPACDASDPSTCQPGDLSGKHGVIDETATEKSFQRNYYDLYLSTNPTSASFFGNRSVVLHANNGTRLNCANFTQQWPVNNGSNSGTEGYNPVNGGGNRSSNVVSVAAAMGNTPIPSFGSVLALVIGYTLLLL